MADTYVGLIAGLFLKLRANKKPYKIFKKSIPVRQNDMNKRTCDKMKTDHFSDQLEIRLTLIFYF